LDHFANIDREPLCLLALAVIHSLDLERHRDALLCRGPGGDRVEPALQMRQMIDADARPVMRSG
jgi:hypothetical protein